MGVDWITLLQTFGLAVVILFAVGVAFWKVSKWTAKEIIIPLRDNVISRMNDFLLKIEQTVAKVDVNIEAVTANLKEQTAALNTIVHETANTTQAVKAKNEAIDANGKMLELSRLELLAKIEELRLLAVKILAEVTKQPVEKSA